MHVQCTLTSWPRPTTIAAVYVTHLPCDLHYVARLTWLLLDRQQLAVGDVIDVTRHRLVAEEHAFALLRVDLDFLARNACSSSSSRRYTVYSYLTYRVLALDIPCTRTVLDRSSTRACTSSTRTWHIEYSYRHIAYSYRSGMYSYRCMTYSYTNTVYSHTDLTKYMYMYGTCTVRVRACNCTCVIRNRSKIHKRF